VSENSQTHRTVSSGVLGREVRKVNWLSKGGSLESRWLPRIGPVLLPDRAEANFRGALHGPKRPLFIASAAAIGEARTPASGR
jgi:hypothetical protein